jgi:hypothetical protein
MLVREQEARRKAVKKWEDNLIILWACKLNWHDTGLCPMGYFRLCGSGLFYYGISSQLISWLLAPKTNVKVLKFLNCLNMITEARYQQARYHGMNVLDMSVEISTTAFVIHLRATLRRHSTKPTKPSLNSRWSVMIQTGDTEESRFRTGLQV